MATSFDKEALFKDVGYVPHAGQLLVHRSRASRRILACGARFGKSTCASMECVAALLEPREQALGWLVAPTYSLTRIIYDRVRATFIQHLSHRLVEDDERESSLAVRNLAGGTSVLVAKSADNSSSLLGEALDFLIVDEAARLQRATWEQCLSQRLIDRRGWALLLSTPRGPGWFYELYKRGQKQRDPDFASWRAPTTTNPHIDAELIEAERARLSPESFAAEYEAAFLGTRQVDPCELCGGPKERVQAMLILHEGDQLGRCPECSLPVHPDGTTAAMLMPDGSVYTMCVNLHDGPEHPPELPSSAPIEQASLAAQRPDRN